MSTLSGNWKLFTIIEFITEVMIKKKLLKIKMKVNINQKIIMVNDVSSKKKKKKKETEK